MEISTLKSREILLPQSYKKNLILSYEVSATTLKINFKNKTI